jgi:predicted N-acetyltransferase YhbS
MTEIRIRAATAADAAALAALITGAFAEYRGRLKPESGALSESAETIAAELARPDHTALLALDGSQPVGCVLCKPENGDLYFGRLAVPPAQRGRGIARALIEAVEAHGRQRGYPGVLLGVRVALPENQKLFASLGYVETERTAHPGFDVPTSITMRKVL